MNTIYQGMKPRNIILNAQTTANVCIQTIAYTNHGIRSVTWLRAVIACSCLLYTYNVNGNASERAGRRRVRTGRGRGRARGAGRRAAAARRRRAPRRPAARRPPPPPAARRCCDLPHQHFMLYCTSPIHYKRTITTVTACEVQRSDLWLTSHFFTTTQT